MKIKVLVIGKNGQLGQSIQKIAAKHINYDFYFVGRDELDLSNNLNIEAFFSKKNNNFDVVINAAAYTNVDKAEIEIDKANQINYLAVEKIAEIISFSKNNTLLIHISTDYVFDGDSEIPYTETSATNPINHYGLSKLKAEQAVLKSKCNAVIIRTSWLYSEFGNNFVKTMLKLGANKKEISVVNDQFGSPTYAGDLINMIMRFLSFRLIESKKKKNINDNNVQIYNFANIGVCSRYEFTKKIFSIKGINCHLKPIKTKDYINDDMALRPKYSALDISKMEKDLDLEGIRWQDSLKRFLTEN